MYNKLQILVHLHLYSSARALYGIIAGVVGGLLLVVIIILVVIAILTVSKKRKGWEN